jgi:hypothetical protein
MSFIVIYLDKQLNKWQYDRDNFGSYTTEEAAREAIREWLCDNPGSNMSEADFDIEEERL